MYAIDVVLDGKAAQSKDSLDLCGECRVQIARDDRMKKRKTAIVLTIMSLLVLTPACLLVAYFDWASLFQPSFSWDGSLRVFNRWPWIGVSIILTIITTLLAVATAGLDAAGWRIKSGTTWDREHPPLECVAPLYLAAGMPLLIFLLHPGLEVLGVSADPDMFVAMALLSVLHTAGMSVIFCQTLEWLCAMQQKAKESGD